MSKKSETGLAEKVLDKFQSQTTRAGHLGQRVNGLIEEGYSIEKVTEILNETQPENAQFVESDIEGINTGFIKCISKVPVSKKRYNKAIREKANPKPTSNQWIESILSDNLASES